MTTAPAADIRPEPLTITELGLPAEPRVAGARDDLATHVRATVDRQLRVLLERQGDAGRGDDPEAVHDMRVAIRRARVALRLGGGDGAELLAELSWLGGALGSVRDLDVLAERLAAEANALPGEDRTAFAEIADALRELREKAVDELVGDLSGDRYRDLLTALADRVTTSKLAVAGEGPAPGTLLRKPARAFRRQLRSLDDPPSTEQLHRLRIKGKRVRYAAELARSLSGGKRRGKLAKLVRAARDLQEVLGGHHDTVAAEQRLRDLVADSPTPLSTHALVVTGRLIERESALRSAYERAWPAKARAVDREAGAIC